MSGDTDTGGFSLGWLDEAYLGGCEIALVRTDLGDHLFDYFKPGHESWARSLSRPGCSGVDLKGASDNRWGPRKNRELTAGA